MNDLWPVCRVIVVGLFVAFAGHAVDHKAKQSVRLVLSFGVQVKEYRAVSIKDRLKHDALAIIVLIFVIFVSSSQPECANAATDCFLESVVIGFIGHRVLLVSTIKPVASVSQAIFCAIFGDVIDCDSVVSVLVNDTNDRQHDLVDLKSRLIFILIVEWTFPLCAADRVKPSILQTLQTLVPQRSLNVVVLAQSLSVQVCQTLIGWYACHVYPLCAY